jgi:hypothetical protein
MQLRFLAKADLLVTEPGTTGYAGQIARYVNRVWDEASQGFPAIAEPFVCDSDSADGRRLAKLLRRDACLLPADAETAAYCGVQYQAMTLVDGVWQPAPPVAVKAKKGDA